MIPLKVIDGPLQTKITLRQSDRIKRLRLVHKDGAFLLSTPHYATSFDVHSFLSRCEGWIQKQLNTPIPSYKILGNGDTLNVMGNSFVIAYKQEVKKSIVFLEDTIEVTGPLSTMGKTFENGLKDLIQKILYQRCFVMAQNMGKTFKKVSIKDTKTRWGSCSSSGNLNFSWRLIFAPSFVVDYLCAHEICHLVEMNHSERFWSLVKVLQPNYTDAQKWLQKNGKALTHIKFY